MKSINFTKMVASGNDFVAVDCGRRFTTYELRHLARSICDRKFGAGADGLLLLEKSKVADIKMRIFNPDGSEAAMCGNGARCAALYCRKSGPVNIETRAGVIQSEVRADSVRIKLTPPQGIKLNMPLKINKRALKVNFINTGVPHAVIFVEGLDKIDVANLGLRIRYHKCFAPAGANVDFVEVLNNDSIKIRTYERGVEDETLACGTGGAAAALIFALKSGCAGCINVHTKSGEILKVSFKKMKNNFKDVWLEGKAKIVYQGVYYV